MMKCDEDALSCDLAQYYGIYNMKALPVCKVALFSCGLGDESRIKRKLSGYDCTTEQMLLAGILDAINLLVWQNSGSKRATRPRSMLDRLLKKNHNEDDVLSFDTAEAFERERRRLIKGE